MSKPRSLSQKQVPQHISTGLRGVADPEQLALLGLEIRKKPSKPVDRVQLFSLPSLPEAIRYSLGLAEMDPKQAYQPLKMDKATWSRIMNGTQEAPASLPKKLKMLTGNDALQLWLAQDWGCELQPLRSEWEEQLEDERAARAEVERENALLRQLITGRR
jgi:hypothetical protein